MSIDVSDVKPTNKPYGIPDAGNPAYRYSVVKLVMPEKAELEIVVKLPAITVSSVRPVSTENAPGCISILLQSGK